MERPLSTYLWESTGGQPWVQRCRWDILGLAYVRWTGFGETTADEGQKLLHCGEDSKHRYGVAFTVRKGVVGTIPTCCTPISSRLICIRISAKPHTTTVIQILGGQMTEDGDS